MDLLKRLGGFLGGLSNQAQRTIGGIIGGTNQAVKQAQRAFQPVAQQVQRNLPRPPAIPRIQMPTIPKIQLPPTPQFRPPPIPQVPKIDYNAVGRALNDIYGRTALKTGVDNINDIFNANSAADIQKRLAAGQAADYRTQQIQAGNLRPYQNVGAALTGNTSRYINTAAAASKELQDTINIGILQGLGQQGLANRLMNQNAKFKQQMYQPNSGLFGQGTIFNKPEEFGKVGAGELSKRVALNTLGTAFEIAPLSKGAGLGANATYKALSKPAQLAVRTAAGAAEGAIQDVAEQQFTYGGKFRPEQTVAAAAFGGILPNVGPVVSRIKGLASSKAASNLPALPINRPQGALVPRPIAENVYPIKPGIGRVKPPAGSVVDATPGLAERAQVQFAKSKKLPGEVATAGLDATFQLGTPGNIQKYVLDAKGNPVGGIVGFYEGPNRAILRNIYVLPGQRGQGAASKLIKAFEEEARINGISEIKLASKADKLYEKLGYKIDPNYQSSPLKTNYIKTLEAKAPQVGKTVQAPPVSPPVPPKVPIKAAAEETLLKESGIAKSLKKSGSKIYADIPGYVPVKNKALLNISENRVALDERAVINSIVNRQPNQPVTPQMNADSVYLLNKLLKEGRDDEALAIAKATAKNATSAGRAVQILSRLQQTTPEGALVKAQKIVNEVNDKAGKQILTLSAKNQEDIIALANQVQKYKPDTREYQKAAGELMKYIENLKPVSRGAKVSMIQTMAQLLNPKTAIRNVVGNLGMSIGEDIASIPAALLDKIVSAKTGIRTTSISNPIVGVKGAIKGSKYGVEDTKLGIKTLGSQTKFDIRPDVFKKGIMKKLQNALGYELGVPDKAFYQSAFDKTLDSVMRANKTKTPTAEMLDIANTEALYATFQNNSAIGNALQKTKGVLNLGKDFGAGDFIIKYPKTPGNIVSVGLDYSPIGIGKGITSLARNLNTMTPSVQREAVRNIGRGITGTGAIAMGVILAQNGIITGRKDSDRDIAALDREQGMGPFTFNATALLRLVRGEDTKIRPGDVVANYDWLQPAAIQLSMGANAVLNVGKGTDNLIGDALESIGDSANTVVEQPVLQGVSRFINNLNPQYGGGIGKAVTDVASGIPSSFVPGSLNQIGQLFDNTARSTYDPNALAEAFNKVKGRIPGARTTLQPSVTTLGQPREQYQDGGNNIFNVFFNPAFVKTIKDNEVYNLVKDIQDRSGETQQAPRVADKKNQD